MDQSEERDPALDRARRREFYRRLAVFAAITAALWVIWALVTDDRSGTPWAIWPSLGMGVAVAIDAWKTFGAGSVR